MTSLIVPVVLLSGSVAEHIDHWGSNWGSLDLLVDEGEGVTMVAVYRNKDGLKLPVLTPWMKGHHLRPHDKRADVAMWYRVQPELHEMHEPLLRRRAAISTETFRMNVLSGWTFPPTDGSMLVLTLSGTAEMALSGGRGGLTANRHLLESLSWSMRKRVSSIFSDRHGR